MLSNAQRKAIIRASSRPRLTLFPMPGLKGDAGDLVWQALVRKGYATDEIAPKLTETGLRLAQFLRDEA